MKTVVIGRTGQLAHALARLDPSAAVLDRSQLDLAAPETIGPALERAQPEVIINAAAYTAVDKAETERERAFAVNATGVGELARAAADLGAPLIHVSTDYVYPGGGDRPYREDDETDPINAYGQSKLAGELAALSAQPQTVILRTAWVYAPWGHNFVRTMLRLASARDHLRVVHDQRGQPTSALDLARACLLVAEKAAGSSADDAVWGVTHYAGADETSWAEFAETIFSKAAGRLIERAPVVERISTAEYPTPAARPANSTLDLARFTHVFGQAPRPLSEALDEVLTMIRPEDVAE
ncbi:MAG: dTDP-4-dehydrorhamnose reductase [Pseudomonadota bacterium]